MTWLATDNGSYLGAGAAQQRCEAYPRFQMVHHFHAWEHQRVDYGYSSWPSHSEWAVPGTWEDESPQRPRLGEELGVA